MDFPLRFLDSYAAVRIVSFLHHQHVEMMPIDALWDCEIQVSKNEAPPSTTLLQNPNALNALHFTWAHSAVRKLRGETGLTGSPGEKTIEDNIFSKLNTKWNRNFKLKSIETNCISTYLDNFEMTSSPSSSLGRTWPCHAAVLCLVICEVHPPQVKNLTLVIFPWLDWLDQESRSHQLRVSTHRTEISKWPSCFEHFEIKVESSEEWCKMI